MIPADASIAAKRTWLEQQRGAALALRAQWATREAGWSWLRLGVFALLIPTWLLLGTAPLLAAALSAGIVGVFVVAVARHRVALAWREGCERRGVILDECLLRVGGAVVCVRDWRRPALDDFPYESLPNCESAGERWLLTEQERDDLDLFAAPVGVFGLLNRASSYPGAQRLRDWLEQPLLEVEPIRARQARVAALTTDSEGRLAILAAAAALRREDRRLARLLTAVRSAAPLTLPLPVAALRGWSVLSVAALTVGLWLLPGPGGTALLLGLLIVNGALFALLRGPLFERLAAWRDTAWAARGLRTAVDGARQALAPHAPLRALCDDLSAAQAGDALGRIERLVGWTESGGPIHFALNLIAFVDVHVAHALGRLVAPRREALLRGASALADVEACASLACFGWEQPLQCTPEPIAERTIRIDDGRHPLVDPSRCVGNDVTLGAPARLWVITGSNMAGKSTFLRMVGINTLLAQIGCAASAARMQWRPLRLITDLRTRDSLAAGESYFLAEVRHLRRMLAPPAGDAALLGLIDEPFRGTNSQDQSAASVAVARQLLAGGNLFLLATHDRHLTELDGGEALRNVHFRENLGDSGMVFDYRLHDGAATTRNALRILEIEGYPAELVRDANEWLRLQEAARRATRG